MFAPYCPTCAGRVLMTARRIVRFTSEETGLIDVVLRCYCGTEVSADSLPPRALRVEAPPLAQVTGRTTLVPTAC